MNQHSNKMRVGGYVAIVAMGIMAAMATHAATVDAKARNGFGRMHFTFTSPAKLNASVSGDTATLSFDQPLEASEASIAGALPDYIRSAKLSADKRRLTLSLTQPYRIRQFVSGNKVGIDLLQTTPPSNVDASSPPPSDTQTAETLSTKNEEAGDASSVSETESNVSEVTTADARSAPPVKPLTPAKSKLNTAAKTPAPVLRETKPTPVTAQKPTPTEIPDATQRVSIASSNPPSAPPIENPVLSTKPSAATDSKPDTLLSTKPTAEKTVTPIADDDEDRAEAPIATTKPATPTVAEAAADSSGHSTAAPAASTAIAPPDIGPFLVTARNKNAETSLNFPWRARTAAAVFQRSRDIWVVFSTAQNVTPELLRSIVPKQVVTVTQYAYPGNTVLRFVTDGSINARAEQVSGGYGWNVIFGTAPARPLLDVPIGTDTIEGLTRLLMGVFDVAPTVRFYDPTIGDLLVIIPAFESGRGVSGARQFPQLQVLPSPQGIALSSRIVDLTTTVTRTGVTVASPQGLAVSENLPLLSSAGPVAGASAASGVMLPYDQWYIPRDQFHEVEAGRYVSLAAAGKAQKADAMLGLVTLYLGQGFGAEAHGMLTLLKEQFPEYYTSKKLALLHGAALVMENRMREASEVLAASELDELDETQLWRDVTSLFVVAPLRIDTVASPAAGNTNDASANTPPAINDDEADALPNPTSPAIATSAPTTIGKPVLRFLKYNKPYIRFYPPRIRQRLAQIAADAYIRDGQEEKALAAYETLIGDDIIASVAGDAEFTLAIVTEKKGEKDKALGMLEQLAKQPDDLRIAAQARLRAAQLRYAMGTLTADEAAEQLEGLRMIWRGDAIERSVLSALVTLYGDAKRHDALLRTYKAILEGFPADPDTLTTTEKMNTLFSDIFLGELGESLPPLTALSLFDEFSNLTPLGEKGDMLVQKLADRLAAIDLLDRAIVLLDNQVKFRATGEARSQIGARLALLHLLNQNPQAALSVLEVTNYGQSKPELTIARQQLTAEALSKLGKHDEALGVLATDSTPLGNKLRLEVLWAMQDWPNISNRAEDMLNSRPNLTQALSSDETEILLKLALAYAFQGDEVQLRYLRDYYGGLIPDSGYKQIFEFITNDTTPLDPADFAMLAEQISRTESFLDRFKEKLAARPLSEAPE